MCSKKNGTLYIGVTNDISKRVLTHKSKKVFGFTAKYDVVFLVYYEIFESINFAIRREKQLKKWNRLWKIELIENVNKEWKDLFPKD